MLCDVVSGSFKLCQFETEHTLALKQGAQYSSGAGLVVIQDRDSGIVWYVDETTGALKTQIGNYCVHQRQGSVIRQYLYCIFIARQHSNADARY